MRRKKQQNPRKRLRNWLFKGSTSGFISLEKKASERILMKKLWDYAIEVKKGFVPRKRKIYLVTTQKS